MARARIPRLAGIKTQCSRFEALRGFQPYHENDGNAQTAVAPPTAGKVSFRRIADQASSQLTLWRAALAPLG